MNTENHRHIDAKGLNCPIPLMLLKKAVDESPSGSVITIDVTDEHAELDFETWCERFGYPMQCLGFESGVWHFQISKA
jgi:tRNA 2-thiouridine synthesizing protein A